MKDDRADIKEVKEPIAYYGSNYTYGDYLKFEFDEMVELIRGVIYRMSPAPSTNHQVLSRELSNYFYDFFDKSKCQFFSAPFDVVLPIANSKRNKETTVVQPDLCVICDLSKLDKQSYYGAPELVVEIISPHTSKKDLTLKYDLYEEACVKEYWIVLPKERIVEIYVLKEDHYKRDSVYVNDEKLTSKTFSELEVDLKKVFSKLL